MHFRMTDYPSEEPDIEDVNSEPSDDSSTEEASGSEETSGSIGRRLAEKEFQTARDLYERGLRSLMEIAKDLGVSRQALSKCFKTAGVTKGSRAAELAAAGHKAAVAVAERYSDKRAGWIEETRMTAVNVLKQSLSLARYTVMENVKASKSPAVIDQDLKALARYNRIVIENVEATLRVLNADEYVDESNIPLLIVEDLANEDIPKHYKSIGSLPLEVAAEDLMAEMKSFDEET